MVTRIQTEILDYIAADLRALAERVDTLSPMPNNARLHDVQKDVPVLMESLRRFGQRKPIVATRAGRSVIAGNGTLMASRQLGWTHVAVSWFEGSDEEARAYALADNRTAELSEWDLEELSQQLAQLHDADANLPASLGWGEADLAPLLAAVWSPPEREPLPDEGPQRTILISVTEAQHHVIEQAVQRVRRREGDDRITDGRALELVCADFLSGAYPDGD